MVFPFSTPKKDEFIEQERKADEQRRRQLIERLKQEQEIRDRQIIEKEKKESRFKGLGQVARQLGQNAKENLTSKETKASLKKTGKSVLRGVQKVSKNYDSNFNSDFDFSYNPFGEQSSKKGKKQRIDPTGSGLDMDAYLNSWVPSTGSTSKTKKGKKVSDVYDPFAGLDFGGYLEGAGSTGKSKRRSKDPIGQFFY